MAGGLAGIVPRDDHAASIGIEQDLAGIEARAAGGVELPARPVAIKLARLYFRDEGVPIVIASAGRWIQRDHAGWPRIVLPFEEQQLYRRGVA